MFALDRTTTACLHRHAHSEEATESWAADLKSRIAGLAAQVSFELTPAEILKDDAWGSLIARGTRVYIPHAPNTRPGDIAEAARRLRASGMTPVPHIAARRLRSPAELNELLARLRECGCRDAFLVGGSVATPNGEFRSAMDLLRAGLLERSGIAGLGIAGHPQGSPEISDAELWGALSEKYRFTREAGFPAHILTQFCFEPTAIDAWERRARQRGILMPVHVGVPGLTSTARLLHFAAICGVRASAAFLRTGVAGAARALTHWSPAALVLKVAARMAGDPDSLYSGIHIFPFGGLRRTAAWMRALAERRFELRAGASGVELVELEDV